MFRFGHNVLLRGCTRNKIDVKVAYLKGPFGAGTRIIRYSFNPHRRFRSMRDEIRGSKSIGSMMARI